MKYDAILFGSKNSLLKTQKLSESRSSRPVKSKSFHGSLTRCRGGTGDGGKERGLAWEEEEGHTK